MFVDPVMRKAMGDQAVALARAVGYSSAGTYAGWVKVFTVTHELGVLRLTLKIFIESQLKDTVFGKL